MIFQIHWQNPQNTDETLFLVQGETEEIEDKFGIPFEEWTMQQLDKFKDKRPNKWIPMICWGDHPAMILGEK